MRYFFTVDGDNVQFIGASVNDKAKLIEQETYPAQEYHEGKDAILAYDEKQGIHWEYVEHIEPYDELEDAKKALSILGVE